MELDDNGWTLTQFIEVPIRPLSEKVVK